MQRLITVSLLVSCVLLLPGCRSGLYPISTGSHVPFDPSTKDKKFRFVIWSNHPGVANTLTDMAQQRGHRVVERARIAEILNEQRVQLTHSSDESADVLRVGRLVGADIVVFAEATVRPEAYSNARVNKYGGNAQSGTVYHLSVSVRAVAVDTAEVRWSGTSYYPGSVNNPEQGLAYLTQSAVARALCPTEDGYSWSDGSRFESSGCINKSEVQKQSDSY
jgi:2-polyprenyl-6-methoxyphenol hydroxylase-like FAD-dependent oxidoreductase